MCFRQSNLGDAATRTAAEPANVIRDLEQADRDRFQQTARFDERVFSALGFEMIRRFAEWNSSAMRKMRHHFFRKIDVTIQPGADSRAAEREFLQDRDRALRTLFRISDLLRVAAEFLAKPDRGRIHQMRAADLDHVPKFFRLFLQLAMQFLESGYEKILQLFRRADVHGRWDHVVARLSHVDMVVRVNRIFCADWFAGKLTATIRDDFIGVGVRARAGTGLENVERKMFVEFSFDHFFGRLHDEGGPMRVEQTEIVIGLRRGPFDQTERANEWPGEAISTDRKIQDRPLGRRSIQRRLRDGHFAHRVFLDAGFA